MVNQQDHLAVNFVADLAPIEAAHCAPGDALHAQQQRFGVDAAAGGVGNRVVLTTAKWVRAMSG
jgi:hypothetical protein